MPDWARWQHSTPYDLGIEEEVMILDPLDWSLAQGTGTVQEVLSRDLHANLSGETHEAALELAGGPHVEVDTAGRGLRSLRARLDRELEGAGLRVASAGTHPFAMWTESRVSSGARYQQIYESMRELARREPTFALHVHVGVSDPDRAVILLNRLRAHLPLLLALSANSPFWQGRDTGLASARTPIFQAFPRVGIPRAFSSYSEYVGMVEELVRCGAFPDPSFLWWDVRPRPQFGTVEVRVMDAQSSPERSVALAALVQAIAHLELEEGFHPSVLVSAPEMLDENRFLAARDGMDAALLDPLAQSRVAAREQLMRLLDAVRPHAQELGSEAALELLPEMAWDGGALRQRRLARTRGLAGLVERLASEFVSAAR